MNLYSKTAVKLYLTCSFAQQTGVYFYFKFTLYAHFITPTAMAGDTERNTLLQEIKTATNTQTSHTNTQQQEKCFFVVERGKTY